MSAITAAVRAQLSGYFEESDPGQARLTFLGADAVTLLRFGPDPDGTVTYATLGCSTSPMQDPTAPIADPDSGPRAELVLPVIGGLDAVTRPLAMLAASPSIEGLILQEGALLDFGSPLWPDARFTGFVIVDSDVPDVTVGAGETGETGAGDPANGSAGGPGPVTVAMLRPVPATPNEFALARAKGVAELLALWRERGSALSDPHRSSVV